MGDLVEFSRAAGPRRSKPLWRDVLGEVLRGERLDQQRILTEVAAAAGVSPQYLSEIERGRKEPSSEILGSVADALGLDLFGVVHRVTERLGSRLDDERREAARRERLAVETSLAFRLDAGSRHPLAAFESDASGAGSSVDVFLLAA